MEESLELHWDDEEIVNSIHQTRRYKQALYLMKLATNMKKSTSEIEGMIKLKRSSGQVPDIPV